ncbi:MAG: bifunctional diaminohydroxyphosphoribosylaminopyrimidine deaminase/5-amino-6-(5-phosphoribosylamino)uracil reductase RibD [Flavobacteriaceae bacterium]|nr:bifunctional diaminohydroxyphosphoribosylaminopyrimidine deaminase/5-amino-6-(5-phosphoribosylamino)uracil reductase RibD [Flavobacteriaceae bacterium]
MNDAIFMERCLELAKKGLGNTYPNPLVGSVIVHEGKVIGEGWHKKAGCNHAEREAISKVKDPSLLSNSTLYVNLEPCDHFGKTPPCTDLILEMKIPRVIIGCLDENKKVLGKGLKKLQAAGCEVEIGILESKCQKLNRRFFSFHQKKRPYVILKWAETIDGFMAPEETHKKYWLTDPLSKQRVHQWRSQEEAIMIGVQTALSDNPKLDTRLWKGKNPLAVVIDPQQKLSHTESDFNLQKGKFLTIKNQNQEEITDHLPLKAQEILDQLYDNDLQSVIIEGGSKTLQCFIDEGLWDEARIFVTKDELGAGLKGPLINRDRVHTTSTINADTLITLYKDSMISSKA